VSDDNLSDMDPTRLMNESVAHEVHLWLENASKDDLINLGMLLHAALGNPAYGWQFIGTIEGELHHRFGRCYVCGNDHEAEKDNAVEATAAEMTADGTPIPGTPFHTGDASAFDNLAQELIGRPWPQYLELCANYNVRSNVDQDGKVICKTCNMPYPNLDDRMLKEPDDCSGCHQWHATGNKFAAPE